MANLIEEAKLAVGELLEKAYNKALAAGALPEGGLPAGNVEIPKDVKNGDWAANHAMAGAKTLKLPPRKIAEALCANIDLTDSYFSAVEIAGPGFLNFRLGDKWFAEVIAAVRGEGKDYGCSIEGYRFPSSKSIGRKTASRRCFPSAAISSPSPATWRSPPLCPGWRSTTSPPSPTS